jgi:hypothetical protein
MLNESMRYRFNLAGLRPDDNGAFCANDQDAIKLALGAIREMTRLLPPHIYSGAVVEITDATGRLVEKLPLTPTH